MLIFASVVDNHQLYFLPAIGGPSILAIPCTNRAIPNAPGNFSSPNSSQITSGWIMIVAATKK